MFVGVIQVGHQFDLGVEQVKQQAIAVVQVVALGGAGGVFQQGDTAQAELGGQGGGLAYMVGLDGAGGNQGIGALGKGIGSQVLEFA
ncbi:hypothetical protein D3C81_2079330 [compost metagenome]